MFLASIAVILLGTVVMLFEILSNVFVAKTAKKVVENVAPSLITVVARNVHSFLGIGCLRLLGIRHLDVEDRPNNFPISMISIRMSQMIKYFLSYEIMPI